MRWQYSIDFRLAHTLAFLPLIIIIMRRVDFFVRIYFFMFPLRSLVRLPKTFPLTRTEEARSDFETIKIFSVISNGKSSLIVSQLNLKWKIISRCQPLSHSALASFSNFPFSFLSFTFFFNFLRSPDCLLTARLTDDTATHRKISQLQAHENPAD